ncbi:hypothetical protein IQ06DRAFT_347635 [Phaeosphaeriaceae sp. SRC1lsM3a]|nr:hypothetical protein IQ06DRAFT_347635 [Stagonospora sp. SRC1lsM3a]
MADIACEELAVELKALLVSGEYSDLEITCGDDSYKVHKAIVCSRSTFFRKAVNFPVGKEAADNSINLSDDDAMVVKLLIDFFYESEYEPKLPTIARETQTGEKYDVPALKNLAREKFERACRKYWADAQFPIAALHSLSTTPDSDNRLRDVLCTTITEHHELLKNGAIETLLIEYPRFTFALVERLAAKASQMTNR